MTGAAPLAEPPARAALWWRFFAWMLGVPLAAAAGLVIVWGALRLTGGDMAWQALSDMGTALFWIGAIALMYPAMIWVWVGELRDGLRERAAWEGMTEGERMALMAAATPKRTKRKRPAG